MIDKTILNSVIKTANLHAKRLQFAMDKLQPLMPISGTRFAQLSEQEILLWELFSSRFSKLQDLMGAKLFSLILELSEEPGESDTFIDKLNLLEKIGLIPDARKWRELREIRNHLSHEYPDDPEKNATYLNQAFAIAPYLLQCFETMKAFANKTL